MEHNESVRHRMPSTETMLKYHGEIERMVFAAEIYCKDHQGTSACSGNIPDCSFRGKFHNCHLAILRSVLGEHHHESK